MREPSPNSFGITVVKLAGLYAATAAVVVGATYGTAAYHGIRDGRAAEIAILAVLAFVTLWAFSVFKIWSPQKNHGG